MRRDAMPGRDLAWARPLLFASVLALAASSAACFSIAAAMGCGGSRPASEPHRQQDCDQIEDAAEAIDDAIFDEVTEPRGGGTLDAVEIRGVVTDDGAPLAEAAVRLLHERSVLAIVRSDATGAYALSARVVPDECDELRLEVQDPEGVWGSPVGPTCGEWRLDYDITTEAWSQRAVR